MAGRYDNSIPNRFLAPIDCYKIPALFFLPCRASCEHSQHRRPQRWLWSGTFGRRQKSGNKKERLIKWVNIPS
jgi:hypothetical protein